MQGLSPEVKLFPFGSGAFQNPHCTCTCVASSVVLWCGLKPIGCFGSGFTWTEFRCRSMSDVCNQPYPTCLELLYYSLFVAVSTWLGVCGRVQAEDQLPPFRVGSRSVKGLRFPEVCLHLFVTLLPVRSPSLFPEPSVERLEWAQPSHDAQTLPQFTNLVGWGDWGWDDRISKSPTWLSLCQALPTGKVAHTLRPYFLATASPGGVH